MSTDSWIELIVAIVSLFVLGLASVVETSLTTVNRMTLREMIEGRLGAHRVQTLIEQPQTIRATMVLVQLIAALVSATMLTRLFTREVPGYGTLLAIVVGALALIVFGRAIPACLAPAERGESSRLIRVGAVLGFIVAPLSAFGDLLVKLLSPLRRRAASETADLTEEEGGHENGGDGAELEEDEQEMISGVLSLEEATAREIMVPRLDIVAVPEEMAITEVVDVARTAGHSRIPVYRDSIDTFVGVIYAKDLLRFVTEEPAAVKLVDLLRPAYFVPESKRVDELLRDLQQAKVHIAIVVDEYGGTAGLVTIEDILEEIVGEIQDEYDIETPLFERVGPEEIVVDGRISVDEIADIFETDFAEGETGTVGGFVQKRLGRIPAAGESLRADGLLLEVQSVEHHRIRKLRVIRVQEDRVGSDEHAGAA